jgi:hypothetical protein
MIRFGSPSVRTSRELEEIESVPRAIGGNRATGRVDID